MLRCLLLSATAALLFLAGCLTPSVPTPRETESPVVSGTGDAYIGLSVREYDKDGVVVGWILPGPLEGTGFRSPYLTRGDIILEVDGVVVKDPEHFSDLIKAHRPGETVTLMINRTEADINAAVPTPGAAINVQELPVTLVDKELWTGPIFADTPASRTLPEIVAEPPPLEKYLRGQLEEQGIMTEVQTLLDLFIETVEERGGFHMLSRVRHGFEYPMQFPQLCRFITDPLADLNRDPRQLLVHAANNLDVAPPPLAEALSLEEPTGALAELAIAMEQAHLANEQAFAQLTPEELAALPGAIDGYMQTLSVYSDDPLKVIRAMRATTRIDFAALFAAAGHLAGVMAKGVAPPAESPVVPLPKALKGLVTGDILAAVQVNGRWYVYGGVGDNTYDASKLDVIIDAGGNDTYTYSESERPRLQVIVDLAGNDVYSGDPIGPASATLGVSLLVDHGGNDRYSGTIRTGGSCLAGIAVLLDYAGNDTYTGNTWSLGSGFYGLGAIVDLGGSDTYWSHHASQAIGGPLGFGLIHDRGGNDLYRANGPTGSGYGTPAVYYGLSQGVGFGARGFDSGGIGVLQDIGGADRYEAGEFSQGGGYFWGLGILDEHHGDDLYYGNRYGQGFGCHQALGALLDRNGNDTYWAMTAATQGAGWDIGMGLLEDMQGNDTYRAPGLSQGGAAMQAIAWLIDWQGTDHYQAAARGTQGSGAGNSYHYDRTKAMSWGFFLDAGGTTDFYATDRQNGQTLKTGSLNEEHPENSFLHGLFIDTAEPLTFP